MGPAVRVVPFMCPVLGGACNSICSLARGFKTTKYAVKGETLHDDGGILLRASGSPTRCLRMFEKNRQMTLSGRLNRRF